MKIKSIIPAFLTSLVGVLITHFTDYIYLIPILFGLSFTHLNFNNSKKSLPFNILRMLLLCLGTSIIFFTSFFLLFEISSHEEILMPLIYGLSGFSFFILNSFLVDSIVFTIKSATITFLLSATTYLSHSLNAFFNLPDLGNGLDMFLSIAILLPMLCWMLLTSLGTSLAIRKQSVFSKNEGLS